ncbi:PREDICTED: phosphopantothenoylcysteine decarboxylase [Thamnophis sirtalis]|uniref:Phosphopantothenoylcysteine decarboxylase n=1 Tax=Thamnophis sirtalis TaxID=35019 RepID=A0A6I9Y8N3_9SAUR|nr:PREDICTED: phosphopantothenoylcysteine decarboxylase [Thamnophis sirtalis]
MAGSSDENCSGCIPLVVRSPSVAISSQGFALSVQTCVIRAWDVSKPLLFCPAMNTLMWEHPITARQVGQLKELGYVEIPCVVKKLVCGDEGRWWASPANPISAR